MKIHIILKAMFLLLSEDKRRFVCSQTPQAYVLVRACGARKRRRHPSSLQINHVVPLVLIRKVDPVAVVRTIR